MINGPVHVKVGYYINIIAYFALSRREQIRSLIASFFNSYCALILVSMAEYELKTRFFRLTYKNTKNVFLATSLLFLGGSITLSNPSFWTLFFSTIAKKAKEENSWIENYTPSIVCLIIGFLFLRAYFLSKRGILYLEIYHQLMSLKDRLIEINHRISMGFNELESKELYNSAYQQYRETISFIEKTKLISNADVYDSCWKLTQAIGSEIIFYDGYIKNMVEYVSNGQQSQMFSPYQAQKEFENRQEEIFYSNYAPTIQMLKPKVRWIFDA